MTPFRAFKKTIYWLDYITDKVILIICLLLFLIGLYALVDSYLIYQKASGDDLLKYKPGYERSVDEGPLRPITGNMVAWISLDDCEIDYPVMQGKTNSEYINKDPFNKFSLSGSIFLDSRNKADFTDTYSLIYGHHMDNDVMFGVLDSFEDTEYFDSHLSGELIVGEYGCKDPEYYDLHVFATVVTLSSEKNIFFPTERAPSKTLSYIKKHAVQIHEANFPAEGDRFIALSTCKYPDTEDRTVVFAKLEAQ